MRKLITVDLDGTLLTTFKGLPQKNKESLIKAQEMGHIVMVATGRPHKDCLKYALEVQIDKYSGLVASNNGALITDIKNNKIISDVKFDLELLKEVLKFVDENKMGYAIRHKDVAYTNHYSKWWINIFWKMSKYKIEKKKDFYQEVDFTVNKVILNGTKKELEIALENIKEKFEDRLYACFSSSVSVEIMPNGAHKGYAVHTAAKMFGIPIEDTISFGNAGNDSAMFEMSGTSVAVANATSDILEMADYVTLSNKDAGVADYLEKYVLNEEIK